MHVLAVVLLALLPWLQEPQPAQQLPPWLQEPRREQPALDEKKPEDKTAIPVPPGPQGIVQAPKHRLQLSFSAREVPILPVNQMAQAWQILPQGQERVFTFDSQTATRIEQPQYFEGHFADQAQGRCFYSRMEPAEYPEKSLRVFWWEVTYKNGDEWIAGAILNEALDVKDSPI